MLFYYEVTFNDEYAICIKSIVENPSKEQVAEFLKTDMDNFNYTIDDMDSIDPITRDEAIIFYDMENEANFPVLGE